MNQLARTLTAEDLGNPKPGKAVSGRNLPEPVTEEVPDDKEYRDFLAHYHPEDAQDMPVDVLEERYRILLNKPLPEYNSSLSNAYEVVDERGAHENLYAMIAPTYLAYRTRTTDALRTFTNPNLIHCYAAGSLLLSQPKEVRFCVVFAKPEGLRLSAVIAKQGAMTERFITEKIIGPICEILSAFQERGVNHGRLNLETLFFSEKLTVGECVSEPSGYSQPMLFEPVERILTQPLGKGSGEINADCFALGVIVFCLLSGKTPTQLMQDRRTYLRQIMQSGTYATLTQFQNLSPTITDFLRGVLNDNRMERWGVTQIREWLGGKRYNLIPPAPPRESTRSFQFQGQDFMNCRALANAFHEHWDSALEEIRNGKFNRWAQLSLNKQEMREMLDKIVSRGSGGRSTNAKSDNEMMARTIIALDPAGPIRMRALSFNIDGLGAVLADAFKHNNQDQMNFIHDIIDNDLPNFWSDQHKNLKNEEISQMLWRLQKVRLLARSKALGFGMERMLYELNPTMACQSPMLEKLHITDAEKMLRTLDRLAVEHGTKMPPLDRHGAAFLAAKLNLQKEVTLSEVSDFPDLSQNSRLLMLKLLSIGQDKLDLGPLKGLANWMVLSLYPQVEAYHNRKIRGTVQRMVSVAAKAGVLAGIYRALTNNVHIHNDRHEFIRAQGYYRALVQRIHSMSDSEAVMKRSRELGNYVASWTGYVTCLITLYLVLRNFYF